MFKKRRIFLLAAVLLIAVTFGCRKKEEKVTEIRFWHSYTGKQASQLSNLIAKYNELYGKERNVQIIAYYNGTEEEIASHLVGDKIGRLPNIMQVDGDSAYEAYLSGKIACAEDYLSDSAIGGYIDGFLDAGRFTASSGVYLFPLYSEEDMLFVNSDALEDFTAEYPEISVRNLYTWDEIYNTAVKYYGWTDGMTVEPNDGKPFFSVTDTGMFIVTLAKQYSVPIIQTGSRGINIVYNTNVLRNIWNFYYSGVVRGYIAPPKSGSPGMLFGSEGVVCLTASTKDAGTMPLTYRTADGRTENTNITAYTYPYVDTVNCAIPIRASGVVVTAKSEREKKESYFFLDWLCSEREMYKFCVEQGCVPVKFNLLSDDTIIYDIYDYANESGREKNIPVMYSESYRLAYASTIYSPVSFSGSAGFLREISDLLDDMALKGRLRVIELTEEGMDFEEAVASVDNNEEFENWITGLESIKTRY